MSEPLRDDTPRELREKQERPLPRSEEDEKAAISAFLREPLTVGAAFAERAIDANHFVHPGLGSICALLREMWETNAPIDIVTVTRELHNRNLLAQAGGPALVSELLSHPSIASNLDSYLEALADKKTLREVIIRGLRIVDRAYSDQGDVAGILSDFADAAGSVGVRSTKKQPPTIRELVMDKLRRMEEREAVIGLLPTGISKLDEMSPFGRKTVALICGQQKSGKTMLANTIEANLLRDGYRGLHFTLEDPASHTIDRLFANLSRVPIVKQHQGAMSEVDFQNVTVAASAMQDWPFTIRDDVFDLSEMLAVIEMEKAQHPDLAFVIVDYAQLVRAQVGKNETREREVAKVSRALRLASMRLDVGMLVLSQLNKDGDARESQALEQDCTAKWLVEMTEETNVRTVKVPIQRNGGSRLRFKLTFLGHLARFENYSGKDDEETAEGEPKKKSVHFGRGHRIFK